MAAPRTTALSYGILSNPFLNEAFRTARYRARVTVHDDGTWPYEEEGMLGVSRKRRPLQPRRPQHSDEDRAARAKPSGSRS